jgi:hypothetical protein
VAFRDPMMRLPNAWPPGDLRSLYLHWTAGDYATVFPAYHVCIALDPRGSPAAFLTHDLRANMRDVRAPGPPYAAHTAGRNSFAIGLAIGGMRDATPQDFGAFPLREDMLALGCATAAELCAFYGIPIDAAHVLTHAEAAAADGYFGCGPDERWDIARLRPEPEPLRVRDAARVGDELRARVRAG